VWIRRFACWALAGTLGLADTALITPSEAFPLLLCFMAGGAVGFAVMGLSGKWDPSGSMALSEAIWLLGIRLFDSASASVRILSALAVSFGMSATFGSLCELNRSLDPICSCLLREKRTDTARYYDRLGSTLDIAAAFVFFSFIRIRSILFIIMLFAAAAALRFPLSRRHLGRLPAPGEELTKALSLQLMPFMQRERKRRRFIWVIRRAVRFLQRGRVDGTDCLPSADTKGVIYLCNHGYVQGAVMSRAWFTRPFRSWSISDLMDPEDAYPHIRKYQVDPQPWVPERWRDPLAKSLVRLYAWLFDSLDSIPVYRNRLRKLMDTFRDTAYALECGDAVMIYPENPDDPTLAEPGYLTEGVGPFYTGFTMIGSYYYARTGETVTYIPMYCSKKKRRLMIGAPVIFDPLNDPAAEKRRIVTETRDTMLMLMEQAEGAPVTAAV
jgi:hypothetical protein